MEGHDVCSENVKCSAELFFDELYEVQMTPCQRAESATVNQDTFFLSTFNHIYLLQSEKTR